MHTHTDISRNPLSGCSSPFPPPMAAPRGRPLPRPASCATPLPRVTLGLPRYLTPYRVPGLNMEPLPPRVMPASVRVIPARAATDFMSGQTPPLVGSVLRHVVPGVNMCGTAISGGENGGVRSRPQVERTGRDVIGHEEDSRPGLVPATGAVVGIMAAEAARPMTLREEGDEMAGTTLVSSPASLYICTRVPLACRGSFSPFHYRPRAVMPVRTFCNPRFDDP